MASPSLYVRCLPQGAGLAPALLKRAPSVRLDWDQRCKSRLEAHTADGLSVAIVLPRGSVMRGGDVLLGEGGELLRIEAAAQDLLQVRVCPQHGRPADLLKAAYHLGNRHVAVDLRDDHLRIEPDHVLAEMLRGLHFEVTELSADFEPEGGAYGAAHGGGHSHGQGHGHDHGHGHSHPHDHA